MKTRRYNSYIKNLTNFKQTNPRNKTVECNQIMSKLEFLKYVSVCKSETRDDDG